MITDKRLDEIERWADPSACATASLAIAHEHVLELVAEVRRLRRLVKPPRCAGSLFAHDHRILYGTGEPYCVDCGHRPS